MDSSWTDSWFILDELSPKPIKKYDDTCACAVPTSTLIDHMIVCAVCGIVTHKVIDKTPDILNSCIVDELLPEMSLTLNIGYNGYNNKSLHRWLPQKEYRLFKMFDKIQQVATSNNLSKAVIIDAKYMYSCFFNLCGRNKSQMLASCVFTSCVRNQAPRSCQEVATMFGDTKSSVINGCKNLVNYKVKGSILDQKLDSPRPLDFVNRFCSKVEWDSVRSYECKTFVDVVETSYLLDELTPNTVVACCMLFCSKAHGWKTNDVEIAFACGISIQTLKTRFKQNLFHLVHLSLLSERAFECKKK